MFNFYMKVDNTLKALSIEPSDKHALLEQILSDTYLDENKQHEFIRWLQSQV